MIKLPDYTDQVMYDAETIFHLYMKQERLAKFLVHYELFKRANELPGTIIECGVFKGTSLMRFAMLRNLLGTNASSKILAFDVFSDDYPTTDYAEDNEQRQFWIDTAGESSISVDQMTKVMHDRGIGNFDLIAGDVLDTIPNYISENPGLKISLLNIDIDFVEPTLCALENFYDLVVPGGIIIFDNYAGEGDSGKFLHGDTKGIDDFFQSTNAEIKRFPFAARPCYMIKK
ncbi:TylF/MycF family methyltransferase [Porticoccaceae bacterium]|jgi:hypothetical protein|nr:TylF/MycF family methyltransferase [Porticoccaceae bacterium]MDB2319339.1 TylF/MycF family methyltransferase [Porticoccaceae bacterium]